MHLLLPSRHDPAGNPLYSQHELLHLQSPCLPQDPNTSASVPLWTTTHTSSAPLPRAGPTVSPAGLCEHRLYVFDTVRRWFRGVCRRVTSTASAPRNLLNGRRHYRCGDGWKEEHHGEREPDWPLLQNSTFVLGGSRSWLLLAWVVQPLDCLMPLVLRIPRRAEGQPLPLHRLCPLQHPQVLAVPLLPEIAAPKRSRVRVWCYVWSALIGCCSHYFKQRQQQKFF